MLVRALEVLFILHADHEQNCSTNAMRAIGSSQGRSVLGGLAGAAARCTGPLHGGANEAVLRMLAEIGDVKHVPEFIEAVKAGEGGRLMGFGHRVYKNYDPRAKIIKQHRRRRLRGDGPQPAARHRARAGEDRARGRLLRLAEAVPERGLLLGADLPGARAAGRDVPGACSRSRGPPGWLAQWLEMVHDPEQKIARPRQIYTGTASGTSSRSASARSRSRPRRRARPHASSPPPRLSRPRVALEADGPCPRSVRSFQLPAAL